jgi:peptide deformylase
MALRKIVRYPDPRLRLVSKPIADPSSMRELVADMTETMYASKGAGLAAIQVGEPVRLFIVESAVAGGKEEDPPLVFINPELVWLGKEREGAEEGCLSFPGIYVPVERAVQARVRAFDLDGKPFEIEGSDLFARAMQHETDHLNGKLLADYVGRIKRQLITRRLQREAEEEEGASR